jgi:hypothetical protein
VLSSHLAVLQSGPQGTGETFRYQVSQSRVPHCHLLICWPSPDSPESFGTRGPGLGTQARHHLQLHFPFTSLVSVSLIPYPGSTKLIPSPPTLVSNPHLSSRPQKSVTTRDPSHSPWRWPSSSRSALSGEDAIATHG